MREKKANYYDKRAECYYLIADAFEKSAMFRKPISISKLVLEVTKNGLPEKTALARIELHIKSDGRFTKQGDDIILL